MENQQSNINTGKIFVTYFLFFCCFQLNLVPFSVLLPGTSNNNGSERVIQYVELQNFNSGKISDSK